MTRYFCKMLAAHWRANPLLYGLTVVGVALGVASVISIQILNQSAIASFAAGIRAVNGAADVIVTGKGTRLPDAVYARVRGTPGVARAWPVFQATVSLEERPEQFVQVIGLDLLSPGADWQVLSGLDRAVPALQQSGWAAVSSDLAVALGWELGERFHVLSGSAVRELHVGAKIQMRAAGSSNVLIMDIAQAQSLFGASGLDRVGVETVAPAGVAALVTRLEENLGPTAHVATPEERSEEAQRLLSAFRLNLTALSLVSLLVGTFLVFSSMRACLVRQRKEFGILRSLGATPAQVLVLILVEALLLGAIGVLVGTPVGYWTAVWNVDAVSSTLTNVYLLRELESLEVSAGTLVLAAGVGLGGALCGTLLPALDVWRRDTRNLVEAVPAEAAERHRPQRLFWCGLAALALVFSWYGIAGWRWRPAGFVLATAILLSLPMVTPYLVQLVAGAVRTPDFGFRYGVRSLGATLANTAFSVSALAMAVCLLVGITLLVESFRETLAHWVDRSLRADIYVTTVTGTRDARTSGLSAAVVEHLAGRSDIVRADPLRRWYLEVGGRRVSVAGVDLSRHFGDSRFVMVSGSEAGAVERAFREGGVLIGEPLAHRTGAGIGDFVEIEGPSGPVRFPVAGIYYDYTEGGSVTMDIGLMAQEFGAGPVTSMALYLGPDRNTESVAEAIKGQFPSGSLIVRSNRRLKAEVLDIFDQTFAVTQILQVMSLIIAACAITLTLLVVAQEKRSEIALYQTLGAYRRQIFWLFVDKGTAMACLGLVLGFLGGAGVGAVLIFIIQRSYFGWSIQWTWPWTQLGWEAVAILSAAIIASLYPAVRASRTPAGELCNADA